METRYYLNGIFFEYVAKDKKLYCVATDGHKLSRVTIAQQEKSFTTESTADFSFIASTEAVNLMKSSCVALKKNHGKMLYPNLQSTFTLSADKKTITMSVDGQAATLKTVDGSFPDYRRVMPTGDNKLHFGVNADYMAELMKAGKDGAFGRGVEIIVDATTPNSSPMTIRGCNNFKVIESHIMVLMPMRV